MFHEKGVIYLLLKMMLAPQILLFPDPCIDRGDR